MYLVRHGVADERGPRWPDDAKRPLTAHGVARFKKAVEGLVSLDVHIDEVFTSPLARARQTAELLAGGLRGTPPVRVLAALEPGHGPPAVVQQLAHEVRGHCVALVGHEPDLGELASHLLGTKKPLAFKKGGVLRIDVHALPSARDGTLVWMLPPKILRRLGR